MHYSVTYDKLTTIRCLVLTIPYFINLPLRVSIEFSVHLIRVVLFVTNVFQKS